MRRREQRRARYYTIHEETAAAATAALSGNGAVTETHNRTRIVMETPAALELFWAVHHNLTSKFGIVRMAELDLDAAYDISDLPLEPSPAASASASTSASSATASSGSGSGFGSLSARVMSTLLAYSIQRGADKITSQLLRAGANAALCMQASSCAGTGAGSGGVDLSLALQVRRRLMLLPGAPRTYLANMFVAYHHNHSSPTYHAAAPAPTTAAAVERESGKTTSCPCSCGLPATLTAQPCAHRLCEGCFWRRVLACTQRCKHADITCPHPGCCGSGGEGDGGPGTAATATVMVLPGGGSPTAVQVATVAGLATAAGEPAGEGAAAAIKTRSLRLWQALPATVADATLAEKEKAQRVRESETEAGTSGVSKSAGAGAGGGKATNGKRHPHRRLLPDGSFNTTFRLHAAGAAVAALFCLHHTREQRTEELQRAAQEGYAQRVLELVSVGCDVDAANECGVTPLTTAVYCGHTCTARALLRCGADPCTLDRLGRSTLDVARAAGRREMVDMLLRFNPDMSSSVFDGSLMPQWQQQGVGWQTSGRVIRLEEPAQPQLQDALLLTPNGEGGSDAPVPAAATANPIVWRGADSFVLDGAFTEPFLRHLERVFHSDLEGHVQTGCRGNSANNAGVADTERGRSEEKQRELEALLSEFSKSDKLAFSDRAMFADSTGDCVARVFRAVLHHYRGSDSGCGSGIDTGENESGPSCSNILPSMRFIRYQVDGACSPPHVDLVKSGEALEFPVGGQVEEEAEGRSVGADVPVGAGLPTTGFIRSTHTFILYLSTCQMGGETALLRKIPSREVVGSRRARNKRRNAKRERRRLEKLVVSASAAAPMDVDVDVGADDTAPVPLTGESEANAEAELELEGEGKGDAHTEGGAVPYNEEANTIYAVQPVRGRLLFFPHNHPHEGRPVVLPPGASHKLILRGEMF